jgi:hypothetical protein
MNIAITLIAAMLAGTGFVLQQHAAEQPPESYFLRLRLITTLLHRPRWLAGVAVMAAGQVLSAWAVSHVALSLAEPLLTSWPGYTLAVASLAGFWLMESAFNAAPLHASLPAITAAEPAAGMLLGVVVFGDVIHVSPGMLALQAAGLAAMVLGVILVARAPVLSRLGRPTSLLRPRPGR